MTNDDIQWAAWFFVTLGLGLVLFWTLVKNSRPLLKQRRFKKLFVIGLGRYMKRNRRLLILGAVIIAIIQLIRGILYYLAIMCPPK